MQVGTQSFSQMGAENLWYHIVPSCLFKYV